MTQIINDNRMKHFVDFFSWRQDLCLTREKSCSLLFSSITKNDNVTAVVFLYPKLLSRVVKSVGGHADPYLPEISSWPHDSSQLPLLLISSTGQHKILGIHALCFEILWDSEVFLVAMRVQWWDNRTKGRRLWLLFFPQMFFIKSPQQVSLLLIHPPDVKTFPSLLFLLFKKKILSTNLGMKWEGIPQYPPFDFL